MALQLACEAFITPAEVNCDCELGRYDMLEVTYSASDFLVRLSDGQFRGRCTETVRPAFASDECLYDETAGDPWKIPLLGPNPVVTQVKIDGATIATSEYSILDGRYLIRVSYDDVKPDRWPVSNYLWRPDTEVGTFAVTYTHGPAVDMVVKRAAMEVCCDIVKGLETQSATGRYTTSATLDGLSITRDPMMAQDAGFSWVAQFMRLYSLQHGVEVWTPTVNEGWTLHSLT